MDALLTVMFIVLAVAVVAMLGMVVYFAIKLLKLGNLIRSDLMPLRGKIAFWGAVAYGLSPLDLLVDPIYLDDIGIIIGTIAYVTHLATKNGIIGEVQRPRLPRRGAIDLMTDQARGTRHE